MRWFIKVLKSGMQVIIMKFDNINFLSIQVSVSWLMNCS